MIFGKPITVIDRRLLNDSDQIKLSNFEKNVDWRYEIDQCGAVHFVTKDDRIIFYKNTVELVEMIEESVERYGYHSAIVFIESDGPQIKFVSILKLIDLYCEIYRGPAGRELLELIVVVS